MVMVKASLRLGLIVLDDGALVESSSITFTEDGCSEAIAIAKVRAKAKETIIQFALGGKFGIVLGRPIVEYFFTQDKDRFMAKMRARFQRAEDHTNFVGTSH